ncbi:MAG TPA: phosphoglycerate dehydrogenase, partial [Spirochaetota bacterium]|nr:phosphoglycerate dehydrogenase [Spirochaetota bacterium]
RQFANMSITNIEIEYAGEVNNLPTTPITCSLLIGLLKDISNGINFVNAPVIAKDMGMKITENKKSESDDYASQITFTAQHKEGKTVISGAVFKEGIYRVVRIDDFNVDFIPEGHLLLTINSDKPGFIGEIGTIIGKEKLNIANMELGRNSDRTEAMSFIQIDGDIPDTLIPKIYENVSALKKIFKITMD